MMQEYTFEDHMHTPASTPTITQTNKENSRPKGKTEHQSKPKNFLYPNPNANRSLGPNGRMRLQNTKIKPEHAGPNRDNSRAHKGAKAPAEEDIS
jgi:hypothetical protein